MTALLLSNLLNRPQNGAFIDSCYHHCGGWDMYQVDGLTEAKAFDLWYTGRSAALPNAGKVIDNSSFPCTSCVCRYSRPLKTDDGESIFRESDHDDFMSPGPIPGYTGGPPTAVWDTWINGLPNNVLPAGPVIGQGDFGAAVQTGNGTGAVEFWLGLNSMWGMTQQAENPQNNTESPGNTIDQFAPYPRLVTLGGVTLSAPAFAGNASEFTFHAEQTMSNGSITTAYQQIGGGRFLTRSFMHPVQKLLVTEVEVSGPVAEAMSNTELTITTWTSTLTLNATADAAAKSTRAGHSRGGSTQYVTRISIPENPGRRVNQQRAALTSTFIEPAAVVGSQLIYNDTAAAEAGLPNSSVAIAAQTTVSLTPGTRLTLLTGVLTNIDIGDFERDPLPLALHNASLLTHAHATDAKQQNAAYWQEYWARSSISLPAQPWIERFWYISQFYSSVAYRPQLNYHSAMKGASLPANWGPWTTSDDASWNSAFVTDYNAESPLYGVFSSNRAEMADGYFDTVEAFLPNARKGAQDTAEWVDRFANKTQWNLSSFWNHVPADNLSKCMRASPSALHFPCGIGPLGHTSGGNGPSPLGDWKIRWCGMYMAMPFIWRYEYTLDKTFGKQRLLPLLSGLAEFFRCWLVRRPSTGTGGGTYVLADLE